MTYSSQIDSPLGNVAKKKFARSEATCNCEKMNVTSRRCWSSFCKGFWIRAGRARQSLDRKGISSLKRLFRSEPSENKTEVNKTKRSYLCRK